MPHQPELARILALLLLAAPWLAVAAAQTLSSTALAPQHRSLEQPASLEQQLLALVTGSQPQQLQSNQQISAPTVRSSLGPQSGSPSEQASRPHSPRSIGEMFKRFFNSGKRSKQPQSSNNWEQQQQLQNHHQQQQQQQLQQNQAATMAATLAAAAANQHAVYASPFAAYSPQGSAGPLYPQFAPYSSAYSMAWPAAAANLAQALRAGPTLIGPGSPAVALAGSTPLYAAASQSYNSYAAPPSPAQAAQAGPQAAASHAHVSAVPPPAGLSHAGSGSALDFHQVLDAFVRTSGFAPAGDQEASSAAGYGPKSDGTPVFSFKKLVSLPFYLSSEEKPLEGLANAMGPAGYSLHSMPMMRRHVRRMSSPVAQHQHQHQQQLSERQHQQQQYNSYLGQLANGGQLLQYLTQPQLEAYSAEGALSGYQLPGYKSGGRGSVGLTSAASMVAPTAVQAPLQQQEPVGQRQQLDQQQELQALLNSIQLPAGTELYATPTSGASSSSNNNQEIGQPAGSQQEQLSLTSQGSASDGSASQQQSASGTQQSQSQSSSESQHKQQQQQHASQAGTNSSNNGVNRFASAAQIEGQ